MTFRRFVPSALPALALLVGMILLATPPAVLATDPPPNNPPPDPAPGLTLVRQPAFNPIHPLRGRVRLVDDEGVTLHSWVSPQPNDLFGLSAIITPDVNSDGIADVAIAIPNAFDDVAGARVGVVVIKSGLDGSTISTMSGSPPERFGLALISTPGEGLGDPPTIGVLTEYLDPTFDAPYSPPAYTFRAFNALSGEFEGETLAVHLGLINQVVNAGLASHIRVSGPADINVDGGVTPQDLMIVANNIGTAVNPVTGALLEQDPSLAATPVGDTNGDGVVDMNDVTTVVNSLGQQSPGNFEFEGGDVTEGEAVVVSTTFASLIGTTLSSADCPICTNGFRRPKPLDVVPVPDIEPADEEGGPAPGGNTPQTDTDGDGIPNTQDCDSPFYEGDPDDCADSDGDGVPDGSDGQPGPDLPGDSSDPLPGEPPAPGSVPSDRVRPSSNHDPDNPGNSGLPCCHVNVNLRLDSNNDGTVNTVDDATVLDLLGMPGYDYPIAAFANPGAVLLSNCDDGNSNGVTDYWDAGGSEDSTLLRVAIDTRIDSPARYEGQYVFWWWDIGHMRVWRDARRTVRINSGQWYQGALPQEVWLEGHYIGDWNATETIGLSIDITFPQAWQGTLCGSTRDSATLALLTPASDVSCGMTADDQSIAQAFLFEDESEWWPPPPNPEYQARTGWFRFSGPVRFSLVNDANVAVASQEVTAAEPGWSFAGLVNYAPEVGERLRGRVTVAGQDFYRGAFIVEPGQPNSIDLTADATSVVADGNDRFLVRATILDRTGAPVEDGTPVNWVLEQGIAELSYAQPTTFNGEALAAVTAADDAWIEDIVIGVHAGAASASTTISVIGATATLTATASHIQVNSGVDPQVTLHTNASDGALVWWFLGGTTQPLRTTIVQDGISAITVSSSANEGCLSAGQLPIAAIVGGTAEMITLNVTDSRDFRITFDQPALVGTKSVDGTATVLWNAGDSIPNNPSTVGVITHQIPYAATTTGRIHGVPGASYIVEFADPADAEFARIDGLETGGVALIGTNGQATFQLASKGTIPVGSLRAIRVRARPQFILTDPGSQTEAVDVMPLVDETKYSVVLDIMDSTLGGEPQGWPGHTAAFVGGIFLVTDIATIQRQLLATAGVEGEELRPLDLTFAIIGLVPAVGDLIKEGRAISKVADEAATARSLAVAARKVARASPTLTSAEATGFKKITKLLKSGNVPIGLAEHVLKTPHMIATVQKLADDLGEDAVCTLLDKTVRTAQTAAMGGVQAAQRTLTLIGDDALKYVRASEIANYTPSEMVRLVEGLCIATKGGEHSVDAARIAGVMSRTDLFVNASYKRCDFANDLRTLVAAEVKGLDTQMNHIKSATTSYWSRGRLYEVQTAAKITRMASDFGFAAPVSKVDFISLGVKTSEGTTDLDAVVTLASGRKVILQCKSGTTIESGPKTKAWIIKAAAWAKAQGGGVFDIKYVMPELPQASNAFDRAVNSALDDAVRDGAILRVGSPYVQIPTTW